MNSMTKLGISLLVVTGVGIAAAQSDQPNEDRPDRPSRHHRRGGQLMKADLNQDGTVTGDEFKKYNEDLFAKADGNKDGQLDREEVLSLSGGPGDREGMTPPAPGPEWRSGKGDRPEGPRGQRNPEQVFTTLDANDDGKLQRDEVPEAMATHFDKLDADGDGSITLEEMKQMRPDPEAMKARMQEALKQMDTNGDGLIQAEEAPERLRANFDKVDANGDGALDPDELKNARPRPGHHRGGGRPPMDRSAEPPADAPEPN